VSRRLLIAAAFATFCWATWLGRAGAETTAPFLPAGSVLAQAPAPQPPQPTPQQRVAMLKQWLQSGGQQLRSYDSGRRRVAR